jgi:hypothetical protein
VDREREREREREKKLLRGASASASARSYNASKYNASNYPVYKFSAHTAPLSNLCAGGPLIYARVWERALARTPGRLSDHF